MSENTIKTKVFAPYLLSFLLLSASYLVYILVPVSDLANSIEHSGMDAVYLLTVSPILALVSLALLLSAYVINKQYLNKLLSVQVAVAAFSVNLLFVAVSLIFSVLFVVSQYQIGFTAPLNGTKWESFGIFILVSCVIEFISLVLLTLKMKGFIRKK